MKIAIMFLGLMMVIGGSVLSNERWSVLAIGLIASGFFSMILMILVDWITERKTMQKGLKGNDNLS